MSEKLFGCMIMLVVGIPTIGLIIAGLVYVCMMTFSAISEGETVASFIFAIVGMTLMITIASSVATNNQRKRNDDE